MCTRFFECFNKELFLFYASWYWNFSFFCYLTKIKCVLNICVSSVGRQLSTIACFYLPYVKHTVSNVTFSNIAVSNIRSCLITELQHLVLPTNLLKKVLWKYNKRMNLVNSFKRKIKYHIFHLQIKNYFEFGYFQVIIMISNSLL